MTGTLVRGNQARCGAVLFLVAALFGSPGAALAQVYECEVHSPGRRFDQHTFLGTHNSYSNGPEGYRITNQDVHTIDQLNAGARYLNADVWLVRQRRSGLTWFAEVYNGPGTAPEDEVFESKPLEVVVAHDPPSNGYLPMKVNTPFKSYFEWLLGVVAWLDLHDDQVITLALENKIYSSNWDLVEQDYADSGAAARTFYLDRENPGVPAPCGQPGGWDVRRYGFPTLGQLTEAGYQIVRIPDEQIESGEYSQYQVATVWGDSSVAPVTVLEDGSTVHWTDPRSQSADISSVTRDLFLMEHASSLGLAYFLSHATPNDYARLNLRWEHLKERWDRLPNFLSVDFLTRGDGNSGSDLSGPLDFVNERAADWRAVADTLTPAFRVWPAPSRSGWHKEDVQLELGATGDEIRSVVSTAWGADARERAEASERTIRAEGITAVSWTAVGLLGNRSDHGVIGIGIDRTAPELTVTLEPLANEMGWHRSEAVSIRVDCTDALSGVDECFRESRLTAEGDHTQTAMGRDRAGNEGTISFPVRIDRTAPTVTGATTETPSAVGWYSRNLTVSFTCEDALSKVMSCPEPVALREGAGQIAKGVAIDYADNRVVAAVGPWNIDTTPPAISAFTDRPPDDRGWHRGDVTVRFVCSDALSGIASCPEQRVISTEGIGQRVTGVAVDRADNTATAHLDVKIDKTNPVITATADRASLWPPNGWTVPVTISGSIADGLAGIDPASVRFTVRDEYGTVQPSGSVLLNADGSYAFTIGLQARRDGRDDDGRHYTVRVSAADLVGNVATALVTIVVPHSARPQR